MSRGSYFELLKKNRVASVEDLTKMRDKLIVMSKDDETRRSDSVWMVSLEDRSWSQLADKYTETVYDSILHLEFNSMFSSLREHCEEHLGLDAYGNDRWKIDRNTATEMIKAIDYILHGKFDPEIERIVGKTYVEIFGDLDRKYSLWKYRQDFPEDSDYTGSDIEDMRESLFDIRTILNAYLIATDDTWEEKNSEEYVLTYVIWG